MEVHNNWLPPYAERKLQRPSGAAVNVASSGFLAPRVVSAAASCEP